MGGTLGRLAFHFVQKIQSVSGLVAYVQTLAPRLVPALVTQDINKAVGIVAGDPVIGPALTAMFSSAIEAYKDERSIHNEFVQS